MSKPVLKSLQIEHYRSFRSERIELDNPTFLVGQNGAGKSNFADAISFLAEAMASPLGAVLGRRGGFGRLAHRGGGRRCTTIGFHLQLQGLDELASKASYEFIMAGRRGYRLEVVREGCTIEGHGGSITAFDRRATRDGEHEVLWRGDVDQPQLRQSSLALPLIGDRRFESVYEFLANMRTYSIDPPALRSDVQIGGVGLDEDGGNTAQVLTQLRRESPKDWEEICELLATVVPGLATVRTRTRTGDVALEFLQNTRNGKARFDASDVSDGTLRTLGILVAAYQRPAPSLMVIEEPESSVHPGALGVILEVLRDAGRTSQIVVTTHSPEILDAKWIKARHLRLVSWDDGATRIDEMSPSVRTAMRDQLFGAGELLRSNALDRADRA